MTQTTQKQVWIGFVRKDFTIIIVCLLAVLICLSSLYVGQNYKAECNAYWLEQLESKQCFYQCLTEPVYNFTADMEVLGMSIG